MSAEDWMPFDWFDSDIPEGPSECKWCKCEIYWHERKPYDDADGDTPHQCPARVADPREFPKLEDE